MARVKGRSGSQWGGLGVGEASEGEIKVNNRVKPQSRSKITLSETSLALTKTTILTLTQTFPLSLFLALFFDRGNNMKTIMLKRNVIFIIT